MTTLSKSKNNPRKITKSALAELKKSLEEFGDISGVVHNLETGDVLGGNQ